MKVRILLAGTILLYLAAFRLPVRGLPGEPDRSAIWAFNAYRQFGLELGRDIIHVAGPLGGLRYPMAGEGGLARACLFAALIHGTFLLCAVWFARRTGRTGAVAILLAISAWFFFSRSDEVREVHFCGITLCLLIMDLELGRSWLFLGAALLSAVLVLVKFNLAVVMTLQFAAALGISALRGESGRRLLLKALSFIIPLAVLAPICFGSFASFGKWLIRGLDLAQGHSEAISRLGVPAELIAALLAAGGILCIALLARRHGGTIRSLSWLALAAIPLFFEFKHAFVRADDHHVGLFFEFAPVVAATGLLLSSRRPVGAMVGLVALIGIFGPSFRFEAIRPAPFAEGLGFQGIRQLASLREREKAQALRNHLETARTVLSPEEISEIGRATVEIAPWHAILLNGTVLRWRPSPVFQYYLVRNARMDRLNSSHLEGAAAAEFMVWEWGAIDGRHPLQEAPATCLSILNHYRFVSQTEGRLLLRRGPGPRFVPHLLGSVRGGWDRPIAVPPGDGMVLASIRMEFTAPGWLLKALYRIPPVSLRLDDGTEYRLVPGTAANGILVGRLPRSLEQFRSLLEHGRIHPECPSTSAFSLHCPSRPNGFSDEIEIEFHELQIEPAP